MPVYAATLNIWIKNVNLLETGWNVLSLYEDDRFYNA